MKKVWIAIAVLAMIIGSLFLFNRPVNEPVDPVPEEPVAELAKENSEATETETATEQPEDDESETIVTEEFEIELEESEAVGGF